MSRKELEHDIVITGVAALTPIGIGYEETRQALRAGKSAVGPLALFSESPEGAGLQGADTSHFDPKDILGRKGLRNKDRNTLILLSCLERDLGAAVRALPNPETIGLAVGTSLGGLSSQFPFTETYLREGFRALNAMEFPKLVINAPPSQANIWFDLAASSTTIANGFSAGLDAIIFSADQIAMGRAKHVVAGGTEELLLPVALAFDRSGLSSKTGSLRPFDARRDGTLLGEGAGLVLIERRADAHARGVPILAEILGYATTFDGGRDFGFNATADGAIRAMRGALNAAALDAGEIDFIAASANGSLEGDKMEAKAILQVFSERGREIPVVAYKSYWGECYGASGAMHVAAALADLQDGIVSATCNSAHPSPGTCALEPDDSDPSAQLAIGGCSLSQKGSGVAMINSFGYTGQNSTLIIRACSTGSVDH